MSDELKDKKIITQPSDPNILTLYNKFQDGDLILNPDFQRWYVWDDKKASQLVESVLLGVPIPVIYMAEDYDGSGS